MNRSTWQQHPIDHQRYQSYSKLIQTHVPHSNNGDLINSNLWQSIQQEGHSNNNEQTSSQASQTSTEHTHCTTSAKLTVEYQQGCQCQLLCNIWQAGGKFLQRKNNKNHHIRGSSAKGVAMPCNRIMAVTTCWESSEPQHRHPPIGSPNQAIETGCTPCKLPSIAKNIFGPCWVVPT